MYKKLLVLVGLVAISAAFFTTCRQSTMIKQLDTSLLQANIQGTKLFGYNPDLELFATRTPHDETVTISAHGYGANKKTGKYVAQYSPLKGHVLTLNLPDHDYKPGGSHQLRHGCVDEILPFIYAMNVALNAGAQRLNLYGFSAGGGVVINTIGILNSAAYDNELADIGVTAINKKALLDAIRKGIVILDVPLKSVEEIIEGRGRSQELLDFAQKYCLNKLRPIDTLTGLRGLGLKVILYFENPDEVLFNRDDAEFIRRLKDANSSGITEITTGSNGGHSTWHKELWAAIAQMN